MAPKSLERNLSTTARRHHHRKGDPPNWMCWHQYQCTQSISSMPSLPLHPSPSPGRRPLRQDLHRDPHMTASCQLHQSLPLLPLSSIIMHRRRQYVHGYILLRRNTHRHHHPRHSLGRPSNVQCHRRSANHPAFSPKSSTWSRLHSNSHRLVTRQCRDPQINHSPDLIVLHPKSMNHQRHHNSRLVAHQTSPTN